MKVRTLGYIVARDGCLLMLRVNQQGALLTHSKRKPWATLFPTYLRAWRAVGRTLILSGAVGPKHRVTPDDRSAFEIVRVVSEFPDTLSRSR